MIPKYRVWVEAEETMHPVLGLDWSGVGDDLTAFVPMGKTSLRAVSIDNVVLMQSTGLFDSSEPPKEIFDGDIVKLHHFVTKFHEHGGAYESEKEIIGVIRYGYPSEEIKTIGKVYTSRWYIETKENTIAIDFIGGLHEESFTVLGNIHQHPHLLEVLDEK